ncbi:MAG TPA: tetratricopeptide repeat protein [Terriglobales bacterium]|nr:tetratricopeptide repeat protein [Terriglobales bacterium]
MSNAVRRALPSVFLYLVTILVSQMQAQTASAELDLGVAAYKQAKYNEAIDHFQNAVSLDPSLLKAHLYLATAFAQQYIPGVDNPDNNKYADQAMDQYKAVLERDPKSVNSVKGIAYLYLQTKQFDKAKEYYRKATEMDPNGPEPYYSIAVIDWTQTYQPRMEARAKLGLKPDEPLNAKDKDQKQACEELKEKNSANIEEGIDNLTQALKLRPDYDDAMAYMNLMYRERADVECEEPIARAADLKSADEWVDLTMAAKKLKADGH